MACQFRRYTPIPFSVKTNVSDNLVYTCSRNKQIGKKLYEVTFEFFFIIPAWRNSYWLFTQSIKVLIKITKNVSGIVELCNFKKASNALCYSLKKWVKVLTGFKDKWYAKLKWCKTTALCDFHQRAFLFYWFSQLNAASTTVALQHQGTGSYLLLPSAALQ